MRISDRGQLTIPHELREQFGLHAGVEVEVIPHEGGVLVRKRKASRHPVDELFGILGTPGSTDDYIEQIRGH